MVIGTPEGSVVPKKSWKIEESAECDVGRRRGALDLTEIPMVL